MEYLIVSLAVVANIIFIKMKFDRKRYEDGIFDSILLFTVASLFSGSYGALVVGTISSCFISLYLYSSPPKFFSGSSGFLQEFLKRAKRKGNR